MVSSLSEVMIQTPMPACSLSTSQSKMPSARSLVALKLSMVIWRMLTFQSVLALTQPLKFTQKQLEIFALMCCHQRNIIISSDSWVDLLPISLLSALSELRLIFVTLEKRWKLSQWLLLRLQLRQLISFASVLPLAKTMVSFSSLRALLNSFLRLGSLSLNLTRFYLANTKVMSMTIWKTTWAKSPIKSSLTYLKVFHSSYSLTEILTVMSRSQRSIQKNFWSSWSKKNLRYVFNRVHIQENSCHRAISSDTREDAPFLVISILNTATLLDWTLPCLSSKVSLDTCHAWTISPIRTQQTGQLTDAHFPRWCT